LDHNTTTPSRFASSSLKLDVGAVAAEMIVVRADVRPGEDVASPELHESISKVTSAFFTPGFFW
jgi:hypothetical protein